MCCRVVGSIRGWNKICHSDIKWSSSSTVSVQAETWSLVTSGWSSASKETWNDFSSGVSIEALGRRCHHKCLVLQPLNNPIFSSTLHLLHRSGGISCISGNHMFALFLLAVFYTSSLICWSHNQRRNAGMCLHLCMLVGLCRLRSGSFTRFSLFWISSSGFQNLRTWGCVCMSLCLSIFGWRSSVDVQQSRVKAVFLQVLGQILKPWSFWGCVIRWECVYYVCM